MPAKRCIETKNMCLLFVDYCTFSLLYPFSSFPLGMKDTFSLLYPFSDFPLGTGNYFSFAYFLPAAMSFCICSFSASMPANFCSGRRNS